MARGFGRKSTIDWFTILKDSDGYTIHDRLESFLEEFPSLTAMQIEIERKTGRRISLSTISRKYRSFGLTLMDHRDLWDDDPEIPNYKRYESANLPKFNYRAWLEQYFKDNPDIHKQVLMYNEMILAKGGDTVAEYRDDGQGFSTEEAGNNLQVEDGGQEDVRGHCPDDERFGGDLQTTLW